ncbi:hypothetical protein [Pantoea sp. UYEF8]|uniref:hypothetical protein n=1 Tax=Pantoea sp. UYEF8 TaxID=1756394 RepID=UPI0033957E1F
MTKYQNIWFKGGKGYGPEYYEPERKVASHCGFDIYYRAACFDVVQDGTCLTQMAGINGARKWCEENEFKLVA